MSWINRKYLLQLAQSIALFIGLQAAITTGLIQIYPDIVNHADWSVIFSVSGLTVLFAILHSAISHIKDKSLRDALNAVLEAIERNIPLTERPTREQRAIEYPDDMRRG